MEHKPYPGTPRWVKFCGALAVAFIAIFAVVHLAGGGFRHHGLGGQAAPPGPTGRTGEGP